jgi:hypothetical protein
VAGRGVIDRGIDVEGTMQSERTKSVSARAVSMRSLGLACALGASCSGSLHAAEYFVSPGGSDKNPGTQQSPFASIQKAAEILKPGDTCYLREGVYRETLRPRNSGTPGAEITFAGYKDEKAVISGADIVDGWKTEGDGRYSAPMAWSLDDGNQIFAGGTMLTEACWPNAGKEPLLKPIRATASGGSKTTLICKDIPGAADSWKGAQLWCAGGSAWICWTAKVTAYDDTTHTLTFEKPQDTWYTPKKGNQFVLRGIREALDAPGEWFYDAPHQRLLVIPPEGAKLENTVIEAKRRMDVIDLSGRSFINVSGIEFRAGGIRTDKNSANLVLKGLKGSYVSHSYQRDVSSHSGVIVSGKNNLVLNCDLGYSSASVLNAGGEDNRIINCNIHHGGYAGLWKGTVSLSGRRILFSHNTVRHAGRDLVNTHGLMESLVQYNDVSEAGWLTDDLGMFYGHNTDFANTQFCYNLVHDNHAEHCSMGIYFDHLSHNAIIHHNVIWNVGSDPIRFNNPSYCNLVFNNTCWRTGGIETFDHTKRDDLFASRYFNNIFNKPVKLPPHVALENNLVSAAPPFADAGKHDFRLKDDKQGNVGAYLPGVSPWKAGCDLKNPPDPLPVYVPASFPWMNAGKNTCFEFGTLEGWQKTDASKAELVGGNGWGNPSVPGKAEKRNYPTGTSNYELRLGPGRDGVSQVIKGLLPGTTYTLSAWARVSDNNQTVVLGVRDHGAADASDSLSETEWTRMSIEFKTGPANTEATVYLLKSSEGDGFAWCDNVTLPLSPNPSVRSPKGDADAS